VFACLRSTARAALSPARSDFAVGAQPSKRKEQRKLNGAGTADADQPPAKRQRTEEEEREWVSRQGGRGSRNREWFDEERKKGQRVVIDLSFDDIMTEREVKSLVTQVCVAPRSALRVRAGYMRAELTNPGGRWQEQQRTAQKAKPPWGIELACVAHTAQHEERPVAARLPSALCCMPDAHFWTSRRLRTCMAATGSRRDP